MRTGISVHRGWVPVAGRRVLFEGDIMLKVPLCFNVGVDQTRDIVQLAWLLMGGGAPGPPHGECSTHLAYGLEANIPVFASRPLADCPLGGVPLLVAFWAQAIQCIYAALQECNTNVWSFAG